MFNFQGKKYEYLDAFPNQTRVNERRVELPLALEFLEENKDKEILEVGNVTRHYRPKGTLTHDVVDLFEVNPNFPEIINQDILTWNPSKQYDAVLSISTLEHTEDPLSAVNRIFKMAPKVLITIPFGYSRTNEVFERISNLSLKYMKRINDNNDWKEAIRKEVTGTKYNEPFPFANAIMIIKR